MKFPDRKTVGDIRNKYPAGTKVRLVRMDDIQSPPIGMEGTVLGVDNGSHLNAIYGEDAVEKITS